jgi:MFS transporter, CP family, cyanate transporter
MPTPPASTASQRPPAGGRLLVLAGIALAAFNLRTAVTSITPLLDRLGAEFGFGAALAGVIGMLPSAAFAAFGVATPALARRTGLERTVLLAMALAATGLVLRSLAGGTPLLLAGSVIALAGMGIGNVVLPPLVKRYFPARVGAVSTLYITVLQMGTILPALVAVPLAEAVGWRVSMGTWSLMALAAMLPWTMVLWIERRHDSDLALAHDAAVSAGDEAPELPEPVRGRVWRTTLGWGAALMFGMSSLATYAMFTWLPAILVEAGASPAFGGAMVALYGGLGLVAALTVPLLAARMTNPFPLAALTAGLQLAGLAGLWLAPMALPLLWSSLVGLGASTFPLALTLINLRTRTPAGSAALSGFMQGLGYTVACLGPLLFGLFHDASGSWTWSFAFLGASLVVLLLAAWQACRPRALEDSW